jgi:hypothetical protein
VLDIVITNECSGNHHIIVYIKHRVAGKRSYGLCSKTAAVAAVQQWYLDQFDGRSNVSRGRKTAENIRHDINK